MRTEDFRRGTPTSELERPLVWQVNRNPRLNSCGVTRSGCSSLASALTSNLHLKEINLWYNFLNDSDLQPLYELTRSPRYVLESVL
ncbi:hypothetical protein WMY93_001912 [Mugilogobius chulae]|uniref:Uncharacterized protein n=1 Tax=Mugilogobius chulae TaxID=88201 RepID=A0AAW0Q757_9GOBI